LGAQIVQIESQIRDAYQHAHDCAGRAKIAATPQERSDWLFVEARWLPLAHSLELTQQLERFSNEAHDGDED
jgi:hypothetical protein